MPGERLIIIVLGFQLLGLMMITLMPLFKVMNKWLQGKLEDGDDKDRLKYQEKLLSGKLTDEDMEDRRFKLDLLRSSDQGNKAYIVSSSLVLSFMVGFHLFTLSALIFALINKWDVQIYSLCGFVGIGLFIVYNTRRLIMSIVEMIKHINELKVQNPRTVKKAPKYIMYARLFLSVYLTMWLFAYFWV